MNYSDVPKSLEDNLEFRRLMIDLGAGDVGIQRQLMNACREDVRFFMNVFVWTIDPRRRDIRKIPFITYDFQDEGLLELTESIGIEPIAIEKSRGIGWTVNVIPFFAWRVRFFEDESFGVMSKKFEVVDSASGGYKTLFGKFDFVNQQMPVWMRPDRYDRASNPPTYRDLETRSSMHGETTVPDAWVQDRMTAILVDEHALIPPRIARGLTQAISGSTRCPVWLSTHRGRGTEFYKKTRGENPCRVLSHGWWRNPEQAKGLYFVDENGEIDLRDEPFWSTATVKDVIRLAPLVCRSRIPETVSLKAPAREHYPFNKAGPNTDQFEKLRSPYYDNTCCDLGSLKLIAMELDIDPIGSGDEAIDALEIQKLLSKCRAPEIRGTLSIDPFDAQPEGFMESKSGPLKLWCSLAGEGAPPLDRFVIGADISAGTGATPSCMTIGSAKSGVVATFAGNRISPTKFGTMLVGTARWFHNAIIIYESQGPGESTTHRLKELGYGNVYQERGKKREYGIWVTPDVRQAFLEVYVSALTSGALLNPDRDSINECSDFEWRNGLILHRGEVESEHEGSKGRQHGDRVTSAALMWWVLRQIMRSSLPGESSAQEYVTRNPAVGTPAWYELMAMREAVPGKAGGNTYEYYRKGPSSVFAN